MELIDRNQIIKEFRQKHAAIVKESETFEEYEHRRSVLLTHTILKLKLKRVPGRVRANINRQLQWYTHIRTRGWLYEKDPTCGICGEFVEKNDLTIDHIVPKFAGGKNEPSNKQLAHFKCNSIIKNKLDSRTYRQTT